MGQQTIEVKCKIDLVSLMDTSLHCPCCDSHTMTQSQTEYEVEHFGSVLLSVATCRNCGYKHTDVTTLTAQEPTVLTARINSLDDLDIHVVKSGTATVSIPEFSAAITPGPYSEGYISNVEGVLAKIEDALTFMLSSASGKTLQKGERMLKKIRIAREQKPDFTFVMKDPFGNSALVSPKVGKVRKRRLTRAELLKVRFGEHALVQKPAL
jgi:zinc finger protein